MSKVKELIRDLVNNIAGHYLTDKNEGDYFDVYQELQEASANGDDNDLASNHVDVWDSMEFTTVYEMIELIEIGVNELNVLIQRFGAPDPIQKIDWSELRNQKAILLNVINNDAVNPEEKEGLEGILHLIDSLQDYAVDEMEISSIHVFDFEKEENRED